VSISIASDFVPAVFSVFDDLVAMVVLVDRWVNPQQLRQGVCPPLKPVFPSEKWIAAAAVIADLRPLIA
jgi:hypothetical protein